MSNDGFKQLCTKLGVTLGGDEKLIFVGGVFPYDYTSKKDNQRKVGVGLSCIVFDPDALRADRGDQGGKSEELNLSVDAGRPAIAGGTGLYVARFTFYQYANEWRRRLVGLRFVSPVEFPGLPK